jgi:hypothetical protein
MWTYCGSRRRGFVDKRSQKIEPAVQPNNHVVPRLATLRRSGIFIRCGAPLDFADREHTMSDSVHHGRLPPEPRHGVVTRRRPPCYTFFLPSFLDPTFKVGLSHMCCNAAAIPCHE